MGVVYALEGPGCADLAVKFVHPGADCPQAAQVQLACEAALELHLQGLESVVQTLEYGVGAMGQGYKVMRQVYGHPLCMPICPSLQGPILAAVTAVHARGIVHGDLKPSNIILSDQRRIVLIDFGLGRFLNEAQPRQGMQAAYTPRYASARVLSGCLPEIEDDLYSVERIFRV